MSEVNSKPEHISDTASTRMLSVPKQLKFAHYLISLSLREETALTYLDLSQRNYLNWE